MSACTREHMPQARHTGLSLDYILRASLSRAPYHFRSYVPGQGYIGTGLGIGADTREEYWRQYRRAAESEIANMIQAPGYAEPGYTDPDHPVRGVLTADWNKLARGLDRILERAGYAIEWSDEWSTCDDCGRIVRTEPDGWYWRPSYTVDDDSGQILCRACGPATGETDGDGDGDGDDDPET